MSHLLNIFEHLFVSFTRHKEKAIVASREGPPPDTVKLRKGSLATLIFTVAGSCPCLVLVSSVCGTGRVTQNTPEAMDLG